MSLANDALYIIRGGLGDQQSTRWSDKFILSELNRAIQRMLAIFKRNALDYGMGRTVFTIAAGADSFPLPADFRGPMAKPQRMAALTLGAVAMAALPAQPIMAAILIVICAGAILTCARRLIGQIRLLKGIAR